MRSRAQSGCRRKAPRTSPIRRRRADRRAIVVDGDRGICLGTRTRQRRSGVVGHPAAQHRPQNCPDIVGNRSDHRNCRSADVDGDCIGSRLSAGVARGISGRDGEAMRSRAQSGCRRKAPRTSPIRRRRADRRAIVVDGDRGICLGTRTRQRRSGVVGHPAAQHRPQNCPDIVGNRSDYRNCRSADVDGDCIGSRLSAGVARGVGG